MAEEQSALRRVATLVARGVPPKDVFAAVTEEAGRLLSVEYATLGRYESDRTLTIVDAWSRSGDVAPPVGTQRILGGKNLGTLVFETGRPARIDSYADASGPLGIAAREEGAGSGVGTPVVVEGRLWGVMTARSRSEQPLPAETEARLASFTELVATAIANAESRAELARLAEEQAALRRVATLVARGASAREVFESVAEEVAQVMHLGNAAVCRYDDDGATMTVLAICAGDRSHGFQPGTRWPLDGESMSAEVLRTGRPVRIDDYTDLAGSLAAEARGSGLGRVVGTPIVVDGRVWGVITMSSPDAPFPDNVEDRLEEFTELVATAIANAESRGELIASRARIVAAADETRRRIERDLHDGIQQRLVSLGLELRAAQERVPPELDELEGTLAHVAVGLSSAFDELREISQGIHPAILSEGGLEPALRTLCRRSAVPVELDLRAERRLPDQVEVAAYYVVSEALTNVAKHARASVVQVELDAHDSILQLAIRDDGLGGADPSRGSGLVGLSDRIQALGGTLAVTSPTGGGTTLLIQVPVKGE